MGIEANLARVRQEVTLACRHANRPEAEVALMAVTKVHPVEALLEAYAAGHRLFGENRVQEFAAKFPDLTGLADAEYHLIGPLQSNKSNKAVELFHSIDTVDTVRLAQRLDHAAATLNKKLPVYIEVKLSHEESKHGIAPIDVPELLTSIAAFDHIVPVGLMTVPPWSENAETARPYFKALRRLRDEQQRLHPMLTQLSMGMSGDFGVAIEEGSTCIRIGTAIFGTRRGIAAMDLPAEN